MNKLIIIFLWQCRCGKNPQLICRSNSQKNICMITKYVFLLSTKIYERERRLLSWQCVTNIMLSKCKLIYFQIYKSKYIFVSYHIYYPLETLILIKIHSYFGYETNWLFLVWSLQIYWLFLDIDIKTRQSALRFL